MVAILISAAALAVAIVSLAVVVLHARRSRAVEGLREARIEIDMGRLFKEVTRIPAMERMSEEEKRAAAMGAMLDEMRRILIGVPEGQQAEALRREEARVLALGLRVYGGRTP